MLQNKLNSIYNEAIEKVLAINIPLETERITNVVLNTRAKQRWGQCKRLPNGSFEININNELVKQSDDGALNTCIHELLHTVKGCFNHGSQWQVYANRIKNQYGINVKRTSSADEKGIERIIANNEYKYILQCEKCNREFGITRQSQLVNNPEHYKCGCGGNIKRIK